MKKPKKRINRRKGTEKHLYNRINTFESGYYMPEFEEIKLFQELLDKKMIGRMGDKFKQLAKVFLEKGLCYE